MDSSEFNSAAQASNIQQSVPNSSLDAASSEDKAFSGGSSEKKQRENNNNKFYGIIAVILFLLIVGELGYVFLYHKPFFRNLLPSQKINTSSQDIQNTITLMPTEQYANSRSAASDFTVRLQNVIKDPTIVGIQPDKNFEYLEIDMSATNNTKQTSYIPGKFFFQDTATGNLYPTTDIFVKFPDNTMLLSYKNLQIPKKASLYAVRLKPGQSISEVYLLYKITPGEKGNIVWYDKEDTENGKKIATFTIN